MAKDLRSWLQELEEKTPGELIRVVRTLDPTVFETTAILDQMESQGRFEAVLFEKVKDLKGNVSPFKILMNTFGTLRKIGVSLDIPEGKRIEIIERMLERQTKTVKPLNIPKEEAPVKEVIVTGDDLDLRNLPIVRHVDMDGGPYLTPIIVSKEPGGGRYNVSWNRMMYLDSKHLGIYMSPRHLWSYFSKAESKGKNIPIGVVLGHHPAFLITGALLTPLNEDEYDAAGGVLEEPLRLVPSESYGEELLIPADAELVIEGEIHVEKRVVEGPFGEFTGYSGSQRLACLFEAKALTGRRDAILIDIFPCKTEHLNAHLPIEASIYAKAKEAVPTVKETCWIGSGGPFHLIISMKKTMEGQPMRAAMAALSASNFLKHVIVVDDDIDPTNLKEVMWAVATRVQASEDVVILKGLQGQVLDPSIRGEIRSDGMIIDATKPIDRPFPKRGQVPSEVLEKIRLEDYIRR
ncbi:MAG: UbiD family decarboxylase [Thermodesulfobacteriota bacterium]|nr:UbiD family decarboxylase [Thermodesulfobacteriota bacterium]